MRKIIVGLFTICMVILLGGCGEGEIKTPDLKVTSSSGDITVLKGGFRWRYKTSLFKEVESIADTPSPDQLVEKIKTDNVTANEKLTLTFTKKPESIEIIPWGDTKNNVYTLDNNILTVPEKDGTYVFEVIGHWKEGYVSYAIKIKVEDSKNTSANLGLEKSDIVVNSEKVNAKIKENTIKKGTQSITLILENKTDKEIAYGKEFSLEKEQDGQWYKVPFKEEVAFIEIAMLLKPYESSEEEINLSYFKNLQPGKYRVVKTIYLDDDKINVGATFEITSK